MKRPFCRGGSRLRRKRRTRNRLQGGGSSRFDEEDLQVIHLGDRRSCGLLESRFRLRRVEPAETPVAPRAPSVSAAPRIPAKNSNCGIFIALTPPPHSLNTRGAVSHLGRQRGRPSLALRARSVEPKQVTFLVRHLVGFLVEATRFTSVVDVGHCMWWLVMKRRGALR